MSEGLRLEYPPELPVSAVAGEIRQLLRDHQVIVVAGATGSGKTTQLPKIALELGRERIAHTQPRRIAARAVAERLAEEVGTPLGRAVGYQVRFDDRVSPDTKVRVVTDGVLLNAIHRDRLLRAYDTIIIDEAHERSLNIDFLLGYLKTILPKRPDLKVVVTSATIDPESFSRHFDNAPVIEVEGRTHPVEVRYRPLDDGERDLFDGVCDAVTELAGETPGDILVFLSGQAEIRDAADALGGLARGSRRRYEILPLYGRLSAREQHRIFTPTPAGVTRIILATNVAETSLTVPGVTHVIDGGTARISRYSTRSKVQRLPIEAISQASALQRSGRAGRVRPGVAIRLYAEDDFTTRPEFTDPEILRTGLAAVILQMMSLGLGDIGRFPFLTPPDTRGVRDGMTLLTELGAVSERRITGIGRALARLPIEPRFGRMLLAAEAEGVLPEVTALVAGMTVQDVRERPEEQRELADRSHARFRDPLGDLMTLLNVWNYLQEQRAQLSASAFRKLCKAEFFHFLRVREWMDLTRQLERAVADLPQRGRRRKAGGRRSAAGDARGDAQRVAESKATGARAGALAGARAGAQADAIHRAVLSGLLSQLGVRDEKQRAERQHAAKTSRGRRRRAQEYLGSRGTRFVLHPSSVLAAHPPETVMSVELVETSRLFARLNAVIDPVWAERLAGPLAQRSWHDPHWELSRGAAVALEKVTLFGVPLVVDRKIPLKRVDAALAREMFLRHALVEGQWRQQHSFQRHNQQLRQELEQLEERTRQRGLVGDDDLVFEFYDRRVPADIASANDFEAWWNRVRAHSPKLLHLAKDDLLLDDTQPEAHDREFPREWRSGDQRLQLRYRFDPSADDDGLTVAVPLPLLPRLEAHTFEQLVPGLRHELIAGLIRTLPKTIRKHVVPANDWATTLRAAIEPHLSSGDDTAGDSAALTELLAKEIRRRVGMPVTADDFDLERLPAHLRPTFRVVDQRGRTIARGKDLKTLQRDHAHTASKGVAAVAARELPRSDLQQRGLTQWPDRDIPATVDASFAKGRGGAGTVRAYPCLVDRRSHVDLVLATTAEKRAAAHPLGVRRLLALSTPSPASYVRDHLSNDEKLVLAAGPYRTVDDAVTDIGLAVAARVISEHLAAEQRSDGLVLGRDEFQTLADRYASCLIDESYRAIELLVTVLREARTARKAIASAKSLQVLSQVTDAQAQLDALVWAGGSGTGFVSHAGLDRLRRFPVYLAAITHRVSQLQRNPGRDRAWQNDIDRVVAAYRAAGGDFPCPADAPAALHEIRWQLEELRVGVFAQQLGTAHKVSAQRVLAALAALPGSQAPAGLQR